MKIVVTHLTRMDEGYFCAGGIDLDTGKHVRPELAGRRMGVELSARRGGPFGIACVVDLGPTRCIGRRPTVEDHLFDPAATKLVGRMDPDEFWDCLVAASCERLTDVFGPKLEKRGRGCAVAPGEGVASMGCLRLGGRPWLDVEAFEGKEKIRMSFKDGDFDVKASVADLRLYEADHKTPRRDLIRSVVGCMGKSREVILSVGLARPWQKPGDDAPMHWLQVNNVHMQADPTWRFLSDADA